MQHQTTSSAVISEKSQETIDLRLPPAVIEKQIKVLNYSSSTSSALAGQLENSIRLLQGHSVTLHYCSGKIEGALLALGVKTAHSLISSLTGVIEGLDVVAGTCRAMCDSHCEEVRQREDLFSSLCSAYASLKERKETIERDLRGVVAERDRKNAAFDKAVTYVETVLAERVVWQEKNGYNPADLPLVERTFIESCHEALEKMDEIFQDTRTRGATDVDHLLCSIDSPKTLVKRWETIEDMRYVNGIPSARVRYIPPQDEVALLREVLDMGTGGRVLLRDVQQERSGLEEVKKKVLKAAIRGLNALHSARKDLFNLKEWLTGIEEQGYPFNTLFETFRSIMIDPNKETIVEALRHVGSLDST